MGESHDRVDRLIYRLIDPEVLRLTVRELDKSEQVELPHELLVGNWPLLVAWLADEQAATRKRLNVTKAAEHWLKLGRDPELLLYGTLLQDASSYHDLNELEREYVEVSQARQRKEYHRLLWKCQI